EHFFSEGILNLLDDGPAFSVSGFLWQKLRPSARLSPAAVKANILCRKHNSDLSPLDNECLKLFQFFEQLNRTFSDPKCEGDRSKEVSGDLIERWELKALIGLVASGNAEKKEKPILKSKPPLAWLQLLFGMEEMPADWGLYLTSQVGEEVMRTRGFGFAPL